MAITPADDYPIHQIPYTFDRVGTGDRNFYDRFFFNGYTSDGEVYFALAMGVYPNLGVMDAAFSVVHRGTQYFVRASRFLGEDRLNTRVGPISIQIVEPMKRFRIKIAKNKWGITGDLVFDARSLPVEEPHFLRMSRNIPVMDYTRITQHGAWSGKLSCAGQSWQLEPARWWGSRDRSWGIRGVGGRDPRGAPPTEPPQFFWNWAPVNFPDLCTLFTVSEFADGKRWHESGAVLTPYPEATLQDAAVDYDLRFRTGTRWIDSATLTLRPKSGKEIAMEMKPMYSFFMKGIGYGEPTWGHGMWVGPDEVDGGQYDIEKEIPLANLHVQQVCQVTSGRRKGIGIYEIILIGPHGPLGFKEMLDPAK